MQLYSEPEDQRLSAFDEEGGPLAPPDLNFDCITQLVENALGMPIVTISLVDGHREWFRSHRGPALPDMPGDASFCADAIRGEAVKRDADIRFHAGAPLRTRDGCTLGTLCVADLRPRSMSPRQVDLLIGFAQLIVHELELRRMAFSDGLTGARTRGAFMPLGAHEFDRAVRYQRALSCLMLDIDHFKKVNDDHGHAAGDRVLQEVVEATGRMLRPADTLGRVGGEEFAILLPETGGRGALQVAERIRKRIAGLVIPVGQSQIQVTVSIGLATCGRREVDFQSLLQRADRALYAAKEAGRDRVVAEKTPSARSDREACGIERDRVAARPG
ncbi:MAG: GGDEF domain-containing protein [Sneathiellaceae bacterium]